MITCAYKEKSLLFDVFKAFDLIESSHKSDFSSQKKNLFSLMRVQDVLSYHLTSKSWYFPR